MNRFITLLLTLIVCSLLAACGTKMYQVTTKTGKTYTTKGALQYDVQSETYKFENAEGREVILNQEDIEVIQETK